MKKLIVPCLAIVAFVSISACAPVEERRGPSMHSSTTTTEETRVHRPSTTSTTETTRSY